MGQRRWVILIVVGALSFVVPAALCLGLAIARLHSIAYLALTTLALGTWLVALVLVNWWEFTSIYLRWGWVAAFSGVAACRARGSLDLPPLSSPGPGFVLITVIWAAGAWVVANAVRARRPHTDAVDLAFPFSRGAYLVTDGGDGARSFLVNYHYGFGRHRAAGVSASMRYAIDVVEIGAAGAESRGFLPPVNESYRIWQRQTLAPCTGRVVHVVQDVEDNGAFGSHRPYGVGNHVVVHMANDVYVVLGHLLKGSVTAVVGQEVRAGDGIARVGNSGWTERPHLHIQAMRSASGDWWHGEPVPMRFGGRFLVRNQVFHPLVSERPEDARAR